jgi:hypothetical protein
MDSERIFRNLYYEGDILSKSIDYKKNDDREKMKPEKSSKNTLT